MNLGSHQHITWRIQLPKAAIKPPKSFHFCSFLSRLLTGLAIDLAISAATMSQSPKVSASDALTSLTKVSPSVYLYDPEENGRVRENNVASSSTAPTVIVLFTWMSAHPVHITKYLTAYQTHYPTSRILIVRSEPADIIWRSNGTQRRRIDPAVSAILSHCTSDRDSKPEILLHLFSNGGSSQSLALMDAYRSQGLNAFPAHVKILDSCPGRGTFKESMTAMSISLPKSQPLRIVSLGLLYLLMCTYFAVCFIFGITDPIERIRQDLNDRNSWTNERRRCYIYGEADKMVRWRDVEAHAEEAQSLGLAVGTEKFENSRHCAHVRVGGGKRYWEIVDQVWQAGQRQAMGS